jgi:DNA polymerase-1
MRQPKRIIIARSPDGLDDLLAKLRVGPLALDTETSGLRWWIDRVGSINLAAGDTALFAHKGALGPVARWVSDQVKQERELVFHNAKFDMHMMRGTFGLHIPYPVHDTVVQSFLVDNRGAWASMKPKWFAAMAKKAAGGNHKLKALAEYYVDEDAFDHEKQLMAAIRANGGVHKGDWMLAPEEIYAKYSAMDPWYTLQLHLQFIERIRHFPNPSDEDVPSLWDLYQDERWLTLALRDMEARGIMADRTFLEEWRETLRVRRDERLAKLIDLAGGEINWNSTPQLRDLLYGKLGIKPGGRRTPGGEWSTDETTLLMMEHPIGRALLDYRETEKEHSAYAENLLDWLAPDGAIHPTFRQTGAETGRLSCVDPNLQQQARESGVRRAYRPRKGLRLGFADYSQVEMRYAAHFADEQVLIHGFNTDPDFDTHTATARAIYGVKHPTPRQRKFGKIINFTTLFGGGENKVTEQLINLVPLDDAKEALRELGIRRLQPGLTPHRALAQKVLERFRSGMPALAGAVRRDAKVAEKRGLVFTAYGHHRYINDERWYKAFNTRVQGSAAGQAKRGLVRLYRELQLGTGEIALLLQIHDEAVYESDGDPRTDRRVVELLADHSRFKVPIIADVSASWTNWQDKEKVKL